VSSNPLGALAGLGSTLVCALYQVLAGRQQQSLGLDANQVGGPRLNLLAWCMGGAALQPVDKQSDPSRPNNA
jgi:hypothetical protein